MLRAQGGDGAVHVIDLGVVAATQVLQHRDDIPRRPKDLSDLSQEIDIESQALSRRDREAFVNHELLERLELWIGNAADFAAEDGGDRIDHAIEDQLVPHIGRDILVKCGNRDPRR